MPNTANVARWGNSLAIRIPKPIAREAGLTEGDEIILGLTKERHLLLQPARPKYSLTELVSQITPRNRHSETPCGAPKGNEAW